MSVPYQIDGISGDGTESSPYLVHNIDEILSCIAVTDAYVKLVSDIYCKNDEKYKNTVAFKFDVQCKRFYADDAKYIYGLKISGGSLKYGAFMSAVANSEIENIHFIGTIFYRQYIDTETQGGYNDYDFMFDDTTTVRNCTFQLNVFPHAYCRATGLIKGGIVERCAFVYKYTDYVKTYNSYRSSVLNITGNGINPKKASYCYFYIDGYTFRWRNGYSMFKRVDHSSIYINKMDINGMGSSTSSSGSLYGNDTSDSSNIIFWNIKYFTKSGGYVTGNVVLYFGASSKSLVDISFDDFEYRSTIYESISNPCVRSTISDMKNPSYLSTQSMISSYTLVENGFDSDVWYFRDNFIMPIPVGVLYAEPTYEYAYDDFTSIGKSTCGFYAPIDTIRPMGAFAQSQVESISIPIYTTELGRFTFYGSSLNNVRISPDCYWYDQTFPDDVEFDFYYSVILLPQTAYEFNISDNAVLPDADQIEIEVTDSNSVIRSLSNFEYQNFYTDIPVRNSTGSVYYYFNNRQNSIHTDFIYTVYGDNLFSGSFQQGVIDQSGEIQSDYKTITSDRCYVTSGNYFCSVLPRTSEIQVHKYIPPITQIASTASVVPSSMSVSTATQHETGQLPLSILTDNETIDDYTIYGNVNASSIDVSPESPATLSYLSRNIVNVFPSSPKQNTTSNGITFESNGFGGYHIVGKATSSVQFVANLSGSVTFPKSINNGGTGCLYFGNTTSVGGITVRFMNGSSSQDYWNSSYITGVPHVTQNYGTLANKTVNRLRFEISSGSTCNVWFYIMLTTDGIGTSANRDFAVYGSNFTMNRITSSGVNTYIPTNDCEMLKIPNHSIADSLTYAENQVRSNVGKLVLTGSDNIGWIVDQNYFYCPISDIGAKSNSSIFCTHLLEVQSISDMQYGKCMCSDVLMIGLVSQNIQTVADLNLYFQQQYANGTPVVILYEKSQQTVYQQNFPEFVTTSEKYLGAINGDYENTPIQFNIDSEYNIRFCIRDKSGIDISPQDISSFGYYIP